MFSHDLCHSQIEYLRTAIDLNKKDRAKRFNKYSIFNLQFSIPASPGWGLYENYCFSPAINDTKKSILSNSRPVQTNAAIQPKNMVIRSNFRMMIL